MWKIALCLGAAVAIASAQQIRAGARVVDHSCNSKVDGNITFTQEADGQVRVAGNFYGMPPGDYGFFVHEFGNCASPGDHFNPENKPHGHKDDEDRHVGDLGNMHFDDKGFATFDFMDRLLKLKGDWSIVGRTVVLHSMPDDFGKTEHPDSKTTGNAGVDVACGVIGILV